MPIQLQNIRPENSVQLGRSFIVALYSLDVAHEHTFGKYSWYKLPFWQIKKQRFSPFSLKRLLQPSFVHYILFLVFN